MNQPVKIRVLYFDDDKDALETYARFLTLRHFDVETFHVEQTEKSLEALSDKLRYGFYHAVIVDVVLGSLHQDHRGIDIIRLTDPAIPKFLFTGRAEEHWQKLMEELGRSAVALFHKGGSGESGGPAQLVAKIKELLGSPKSPYRLNLALEIREDGWLPQSRLTRLQAPNQTQAQARAELEDLLRRLFFDYETIELGLARDLPDDTTLIRVRGRTKDDIWTSVVLHFGLRETMRRIDATYNAFLRFTGNAAGKLESGETLHYGGAVYRLNGDPEAYRPVADDLARLGQQAIAPIIDNLFDRVLRPLYTARAVLPGAAPFDARYRQVLGLDDRLTSVFRDYMERLLAAHPLAQTARDRRFYLHADDLLPGTTPSGGNKLYLPDVDRVVFDSESLFRLASPAPESVVYGGLDASTLFYDPAGCVCLPASAETGRGFFLRDVIALEADVMLRLIVGLRPGGGAGDPRLLHALQVWLEPAEVAGRFHAVAALDDSAYRPALAAAARLRRVAGQLGEVDMRYYYGGLLFHAARLALDARRPSGSGPAFPPHFLHAALAAALLAARLESWPELPWRPIVEPVGDELVVDVQNSRMYVPECGRWVPLTPQRLLLMRLLSARPWELVTDDEISQNVFGGPDGDVYNLVSQVRGLIRECAGQGLRRRYIERVRGKGYIFRPNGADRPD